MLKTRQDLILLIDNLKKEFPKIRYNDITTFKQAEYYMNGFDLIVRSDQFRSTILELEDILIDNISEDTKNKLVTSLKSVNFINSYHELFAGKIFQDIGYNLLDYEPFISGKTPDWKIKKNSRECIVEVFTVNKYNDLTIEETQLTFLFFKIQQLPYPYEIFINTSQMNNSLDSVKKINGCISEIETYIKNQEKFYAKFLTLSCGIHLKFRYNEQCERINIINNFKTLLGGANTYRFVNSYKYKYNKYKDLIDNIKIPFIICGITEEFNRLNTEQFKYIISGNNINEGVLTNEDMPEVSGFLLIKNNYYTNFYDIDYVENPNAILKFIV